MIHSAVSSLASWLVVAVRDGDQTALLIFDFLLLQLHAELVDVERPDLEPVVVVLASRVQFVLACVGTHLLRAAAWQLLELFLNRLFVFLSHLFLSDWVKIHFC